MYIFYFLLLISPSFFTLLIFFSAFCIYVGNLCIYFNHTDLNLQRHVQPIIHVEHYENGGMRSCRLNWSLISSHYSTAVLAFVQRSRVTAHVSSEFINYCKTWVLGTRGGQVTLQVGFSGGYIHSYRPVENSPPVLPLCFPPAASTEINRIIIIPQYICSDMFTDIISYISHHTTPHHTTPHHTTPHHITSHHITSHHIRAKGSG